MVSLISTEKLDAVLRVRCTVSDLKRWGDLADEYDESLSAMVRRLLDQLPPRPRRPLATVNPLLLRQLALAGNNLAQISRVVNANSGAGARLQAVVILTQLTVIERQLGQLLREGSDQ
ncbi:MAG: hypothetical protein II336_13740 [Loktanella sp.]|nr:hypothetical protein [Loktanella sp.]